MTVTAPWKLYNKSSPISRTILNSYRALHCQRYSPKPTLCLASTSLLVIVENIPLWCASVPARVAKQRVLSCPTTTSWHPCWECALQIQCTGMLTFEAFSLRLCVTSTVNLTRSIQTQTSANMTFRPHDSRSHGSLARRVQHAHEEIHPKQLP